MVEVVGQIGTKQYFVIFGADFTSSVRTADRLYSPDVSKFVLQTSEITIISLRHIICMCVTGALKH
jgi:hypothetical protein